MHREADKSEWCRHWKKIRYSEEKAEGRENTDTEHRDRKGGGVTRSSALHPCCLTCTTQHAKDSTAAFACFEHRWPARQNINI